MPYISPLDDPEGIDRSGTKLAFVTTAALVIERREPGSAPPGARKVGHRGIGCVKLRQVPSG